MPMWQMDIVDQKIITKIEKLVFEFHRRYEVAI